MFHLSIHLISLGSCSAHLAYRVNKKGNKKVIFTFYICNTSTFRGGTIGEILLKTIYWDQNRRTRDRLNFDLRQTVLPAGEKIQGDHQIWLVYLLWALVCLQL